MNLFGDGAHMIAVPVDDNTMGFACVPQYLVFI